jgi:hypothetical protein
MREPTTEDTEGAGDFPSVGKWEFGTRLGLPDDLHFLHLF